MVGLIPARGGWKGIPRKNLAEVAGKPLLVWTIEAARGAGTLARVVVSTDDDEIAHVARAHGVEVLVRPAELAADETPKLAVIVDAARELGSDSLTLLQPTSPLRTSRHIDEAVQLFESTSSDAVVSVAEVPHQFRPGKLLELEGDRVAVSGGDPLHRGNAPLYARNGPAVLVVRTAGLAERGLYGGDVRAYLMESSESLDIDSVDDLRIAEALLR